MPPKSRRNGSDDDREGTTPTTPDAAPKMHILRAEIRQDRKETEELLAGFERPNRSPPRRPTPRPRDFVDYHLARGTPADERRAPREASVPRAAEEITVSRRPRRTSPVLAWGAIIASMIVFGGGVTYFVAGGKPTADRTTAATGHTTSANAAHAGSSRDVRTTSSREGEIPPPAAEDADGAPPQAQATPTPSGERAHSPSPPPRVARPPRAGVASGQADADDHAPASSFAAPDRATDGKTRSAPSKAPSQHTTATPTADMGPLQKPSTREDFIRDL